MSKPGNRKFIWIACAALFLLHQDVWFWGDRTLVLGFLPIGLAYHVLFSLATAVLWLAAVKWAWPGEMEAWADEFDTKPEERA